MQSRQRGNLGVKPNLTHVYNHTESQYQGSTRTQSVWNGHSSIKSMKAQKEAIREDTMRRIDSMGFKAPVAWRDELYRNELHQIDLKQSLVKKDPHGKTLN